MHRTAMETPILPCPNVIEWITKRIEHKHRSILMENKKIAKRHFSRGTVAYKKIWSCYAQQNVGKSVPHCDLHCLNGKNF